MRTRTSLRSSADASHAGRPTAFRPGGFVASPERPSLGVVEGGKNVVDIAPTRSVGVDRFGRAGEIELATLTPDRRPARRGLS
jgi:hypothetical protein